MLLSELHYDMLSDSELIELVRKDDKKAFEMIYRRYWPLLINVAYKRFQSLPKAERLVGDLFMEVFKIRQTLQDKFSLKVYLDQQLRNKILKEFRSDNNQLTGNKDFFY